MILTALPELVRRARSFVPTLSFIILQNNRPRQPLQEECSPRFRDEDAEVRVAKKRSHALAEWRGWHSRPGLQLHSLEQG